MNKQKLTLSIDTQVIAAGKQAARTMDMSLSEVVERYLHRLGMHSQTYQESKTPITDSLTAIMPKMTDKEVEQAKNTYFKKKYHL